MTRWAAVALVLLTGAGAEAGQPVRLAGHPALSPDGAQLAFEWNGDVWTVPSGGGVARPLTSNPARDRQPKFSPDGKEVAFVSDRDGSPQIYVVPAQGGAPQRLTYHTAGYSLEEWAPDGRHLLVSSDRDNFWRHPGRFFFIDRAERPAEAMVFDDYGQNGTVSPDGRRILFTREGPAWWRKGYHGSQASQIWMYDRLEKQFTRVLNDDRGCLWPLWKPDGRGFYYVGAQSGSFNLREHDLANGADRQLTHFTDDSVVFPCVSRDGSTVVFRHLFDFYRLRPGTDKEPVKLTIEASADRTVEHIQRRTLQTANQAAFTQDGLEVAFIAGGDLWVMDTELREPKAVTRTAEEERDPVFTPDGEALFFVSDQGGKCDVWKAERADKGRYWWQNADFKLARVTTDGEAKSGLTVSPDGTRLAFLRGRGDLWVTDLTGQDAKPVVKSFTRVEYDWSPDGKWMVYSAEDNDFNRDIWVTPLDGSRPPFNISRHPYNDQEPVWSPDGKLIAFTGRRDLTEVDIHYVFLRAEDAEATSRDRSLEKALDKMNKARKPPARSPIERVPPGEAAKPGDPPAVRKPAPPVVIDFDGIHDRIRRVAIPESTETGLFWSPDGKKLAFTASVEGRRGTYTIDIPDDTRPKLLTTTTGSQAHWLKAGNQIVWLANNLPASFTIPAAGAARPTPTPAAEPAARTRPGRGGAPSPAPLAGPSPGDAPAGEGTAYRFTALQEVDVPKKNAAAFDLCWRIMRDQFYDERLGNRDWNAVRRKYIDMAAEAPDAEALGTVVSLMLGELNGSHLGFTPGSTTRVTPRAPGTPGPADPEPALGPTWNETTAHLGVRFVPDFPGPGLKVRDVLPGGPAEQKRSRLEPGDVILTIDNLPVSIDKDLTKALNGPPNREATLQVKGADGKERSVVVRPISYAAARNLLYEQWVRHNREAVDKLSGGKLGYLHISAMSQPSFNKFIEELAAVGEGKDGLVIDVRENGGGSTTDHLLTALSQPVHAVTVPRGGGPGYPSDRKIYATWSKPIVVLCNQNSFSNAEIFSHAIKTLKRGPLVGVPTAGGVISTGGTAIMDVGFLRLPFRGWYKLDDGEDMELNGAVPDKIVWPQPGQLPRGQDVQLEAGVDVLKAEVEAWKKRPVPPLHKASERNGKRAAG